MIPNTLGFYTAKVDQVKFDTMELHARPELAAQQRMVDDASGDVKVRKLCLKPKYTQTQKGRQTSASMTELIYIMRGKNAKTFYFLSGVAY